MEEQHTQKGYLKPLLSQEHQLPHDTLANSSSEASRSSASLDSIAVVEDNSTKLGSLHYQSRFLAYLYISHFLSRWGARMWEFAVGLFMLEIWPDSLLLTSLYGLMEDLSVASMGISVGEWVDKTPRLKAVQVSLGVQNGSMVAATLALVILLLHPGSAAGGYKVYITLVVLVNLLGGISALAGVATNISVERDWVVVIAAGKPSGTLTKMNSVMRRIDLSCKLLAPVLVGFIMSSVSVLASAILISVWNVVSIGFEYYLLLTVYHETPELHERDLSCGSREDVVIDEGVKDLLNVAQDDIESPTHVHERDLLCDDSEDAVTNEEVKEELSSIAQDDIGTPTHDHTTGGMRTTSKEWVKVIRENISHLQVVEGWKVYIRQEMVLAALSLAMLYFTVLSFGSLMTAALKWKGVPAYVLGLARGISALVGISATIAYPRVHSHLQAIRTGLWSGVLQWALLSLCVASVWVHSSWVSSTLLMGGVATSRLGLWMFDLAVIQLMQESIPEGERGVVGGVQNSLQSFLEMLSFIAGILIPNPKDFGKLVLLSYGSVTVALVLYMIHVYRARGHLLHIDRLFRSL